jgi:hypothetical protein
MVILLFGTRASLEAMLTVTFVCHFCGVAAPQQVYRRSTRFTLFFLPLFTLSRKHFVECSNCGGTTELTAEQANHALDWAAARTGERR